MRIAIIFGGASSEHDISIITGVTAINAAAEKHSVTPIYIGRDGRWYVGKNMDKISTFTRDKMRKKPVHLRPSSPYLYSCRGKKIAKLDAVINCCHGGGGEDGCLSGVLELSGIPYAGSGVLASSVGMDKAFQKQIFKSLSLDTTDFICVEKSQLDAEFFDVTKRIAGLKFPLMVKPARLGSSIGIARANDFKQLFQALSQAFLWDEKVVIENALTDFIEVNCAVLGHGEKLIVSQIEQPLSTGFLSFSDKYERYSGGKTGGGKGDSGRYLPAHIPPEMAERVRSAARQVFSALGCSGVARIDFMIEQDTLYVGEINTVPGSLSSYLFAFDGMDFAQLIDKLLVTAAQKQSAKAALKKTFVSSVLVSKKSGKNGSKN